LTAEDFARARRATVRPGIRPSGSARWTAGTSAPAAAALARIAAALRPGARLLIDGGDPLRAVPLSSCQSAQR
jgi:hypothetical protein